MLCSLKDDATREAYLPAYFRTLLKAAALNDAAFDEVADWKCCSVMMPPGKRVDNTWTLIPAGFFPALWKLGVSGCQVSGRISLSTGADTASVRTRGRCLETC